MPRKRSRGVRRSEQQWIEILRRFESSGLGSRQFCHRDGLPLSSLQRWKRRLGFGPAGEVRRAHAASVRGCCRDELVARGVVAWRRDAAVPVVARVPDTVAVAAANPGLQQPGRHEEIVSRPGGPGAGRAERGPALRLLVRLLQPSRKLRQARDVGSHGLLPVRQAARAGSLPSSFGCSEARNQRASISVDS